MFIPESTQRSALAGLGPEVGHLFLGLIQPAGPGACARLEGELRHFETRMREEAEEALYVDLELVERLVAAAQAALSFWGTLSPRGRALLSAGIRYLFLPEEGDAERISLVAFDDDARVFNFVLEALDLPIPLISLESGSLSLFSPGALPRAHGEEHPAPTAP